MAMQPIRAILILDADGNRLAVKYCTSDRLREYSEQTKLEAQLVQKANRVVARTEVDILMVNDFIVLFRSSNDVTVFVVGDPNENELILLEVTNAVYQGLSNITNGQLGKRQVLENLDSTFLMLDEVVDAGLIFEVDPDVITNRINMNVGDGLEQTAFNQAITTAKENIMRSFLSGSS